MRIVVIYLAITTSTIEGINGFILRATLVITRIELIIAFYAYGRRFKYFSIIVFEEAFYLYICKLCALFSFSFFFSHALCQ